MFQTDPTTGAPYTYALARAADCADPDTPYGRTTPPSPGADFLHNVYDAAEEARTDPYRADDDPSDTAHGVADGCVPVYSTHNLWATFADLCAYREDLDEIGYTYVSDHPEDMPATALYAIGHRLALHILTADTDDEGEG